MTRGRRSADFQIDAGGLRWLGELDLLENAAIHLPDGLTAEEFSPLRQADRLTTLRLYCPPLDAGHVKILSELPNLQALYLHSASRSVKESESLHHLAKLPQLHWLQLCGTRDEDIKQVSQFDTLQWLRIEGRDLTDTALRLLSELPALETLDLGKAGFTEQGLEELRARRPGLRISQVTR